MTWVTVGLGGLGSSIGLKRAPGTGPGLRASLCERRTGAGAGGGLAWLGGLASVESTMSRVEELSARPAPAPGAQREEAPKVELAP